MGRFALVIRPLGRRYFSDNPAFCRLVGKPTYQS
jgi:hypothetical protein